MGIALAGLVALVSATSVARGEAAEVSAAEDAARPFVVKIHADWCGTCQALEPTLENVQKSVGSRARFVVLDVTDKDAVAVSTAEADRLGMRGFFDAYKSKTGTVGVLDGATREPVRVMKGELDAAAYEAAIQRASASAAS
jgi:thiol-disulfide isomerase/thioredoxin